MFCHFSWSQSIKRGHVFFPISIYSNSKKTLTTSSECTSLANLFSSHRWWRSDWKPACSESAAASQGVSWRLLPCPTSFSARSGLTSLTISPPSDFPFPFCFNLLPPLPIAWLSATLAVWWKANQVDKEAPDIEIKWAVQDRHLSPACKGLLVPQSRGDKIGSRTTIHACVFFASILHFFENLLECTGQWRITDVRWRSDLRVSFLLCGGWAG